MKTTLRDTITGLVAIGAALGFAVLLMRFGELPGLERGRWTLTVRLDDAGGLRAGNAITLDGVPIGAIEAVALTGDRAHPVTVTARIRSEFDVPAHVDVQVQGSLLGGGAILAFSTRAIDDPGAPLARDGAATLTGSGSGPIDRAIAQAGEMLKEQIRAELAPFRDAAQAVTALADTYRELGDRLGAIVAPLADAAETGEGDGLDGLLARIGGAVDEIATTARLAQGWLGDEALRADIGGTVTEARETIAALRGTADRYGILADELREHADRLTAGVMPAADGLAAAVGDMRRMMALATDGDGTVARLLNRPDLHENLVDAAQRLDRALAELELLFAKIRQEGIQLDF